MEELTCAAKLSQKGDVVCGKEPTTTPIFKRLVSWEVEGMLVGMLHFTTASREVCGWLPYTVAASPQ